MMEEATLTESGYEGEIESDQFHDGLSCIISTDSSLSKCNWGMTMSLSPDGAEGERHVAGYEVVCPFRSLSLPAQALPADRDAGIPLGLFSVTLRDESREEETGREGEGEGCEVLGRAFTTQSALTPETDITVIVLVLPWILLFIVDVLTPQKQLHEEEKREKEREKEHVEVHENAEQLNEGDTRVKEAVPVAQ
ncbi:hypothetical protein KIPB_008482 [Kipferlia bialata]|uniref:Uncharacterized protein n=1 Tax=Kipferlia bialata TaxID=797122 RepID=A0A9K3D1Z4_9EUKA|nr:hypothetical protein KIPB_008482 [Kipferlia bialata]|eukprot:g8482.t1